MIQEDFDDYDWCKSKLWTAPELLDNNHGKIVLGTPKGDIFAFSIIVHEIAERTGPWGTNITQWEPQYIVKMIRQGKIRPEIDRTLVPEELASLLEKCWSDDPKDRPIVSDVRSVIKKINKDNKSGMMLYTNE